MVERLLGNNIAIVMEKSRYEGKIAAYSTCFQEERYYEVHKISQVVMDFNIIKCHGSGNDFIMIDERENQYAFAEEERTQLAIRLCNRMSGIGADGILFVQDSPPEDGRMIIVNADGSEASMCGNGLRCVVRLISETSGKKQMKIATRGGIYECEVWDGFFEDMTGYSVRIDTIDFLAGKMLTGWKDDRIENDQLEFLPGQLAFSSANVPNPHIVAPLSKPDTPLLEAVGDRCNLQKEPFYDGVNVNFFTPLGKQSLFVETYERGVGLTNACGTGMVASSLIAYHLGFVAAGNWIEIFNKGGFVKTRIEKDEWGAYAVELLGNATYTFAGKVFYDFATDAFEFKKTATYSQEVAQYEAIVERANSVL